MVQSVFELTGMEDTLRRLEAIMDIPENLEASAAHTICEVMRRSAVQTLDRNRKVDTGELRNSILTADDTVEHPRSEVVSVGIRTDCPHAIFVEYGTGPLGDGDVPHTSKTSWVYYDSKGWNTREPGFYRAYPMPPTHFMSNALQNNRDAFVKIIRDEVEVAFR